MCSKVSICKQPRFIQHRVNANTFVKYSSIQIAFLWDSRTTFLHFVIHISIIVVIIQKHSKHISIVSFGLPCLYVRREEVKDKYNNIKQIFLAREKLFRNIVYPCPDFVFCRTCVNKRRRHRTELYRTAFFEDGAYFQWEGIFAVPVYSLPLLSIKGN